MINQEQILLSAFPTYCEKDIRSLNRKINLVSEFEISEDFVESFSVAFQGEILQIPFRIYFKEVSENNLTKDELILLDCFFTRHHNGFIRQRSLEKIITSEVAFITPFVFQLLGEYVIQIIDVINKNLSKTLANNIYSFAKENPEYLQLTKHRMISYWNCYYRSYSSEKSDYVGFKILEKLNLITN